MKNLYLVILLLAFAANLSAFDKVWELQFSSTPHHVHYTEGHKELIVGEGNTFKKYNAETGVLLDSVVYSLDALKDYTIGEYQITDDLKSLYVLAMLKADNKNEFVFRVSIQNSNIIDSLYTQHYIDNSGSYIYVNSIPGSLNKVGKDKFIYSVNSNSNYAPIYTASSGIIRIFENNNIEEIKGSVSLIRYNSYVPTMLLYTTSSSSRKSGPNGYSSFSSATAWTSPPNKITKLNNLNNVDLENIFVVILSKSNNYIYYSSGKNIIRFDYIKNNTIPNDFKPTSLLPLINDDELVINNNGKLYYYNFKVNTCLDSIDLGPNNTYTTDLNNDYLVSINESYITTYKSSANPNKVFSFLSDTTLNKSVGDTITLNAISNLIPLKEEWDLGDGRTITSDTIKFTYPKKGDYLVKYTGTYKDTVINHLCQISVLDTLVLSLTHKVEFVNGKTNLIVYSNKGNNYKKVNYKIVTRKGDISYKVIDSTSDYMMWEVDKNELYTVSVKINNTLSEKTSNIEILIPNNNIANTEYAYEDLPNFYDVKVESNEEDNIYLIHVNKNITDISTNYKLYLVNADINVSLLKTDYSLKNMSNIKKLYRHGNDYNYADAISQSDLNEYPKIIGEHPSYIIDSDIKKLYVLEKTIKDTLGIPYFKDLGFSSMTNMNKINNKYLYYGYYTNNTNNNIYFGAYLNSSTFSLLGNMPKNYYSNVIYSNDLNNIYMFSVNKNLNVFKLNNNLEITDTLTSQNYSNELSKTMNNKIAMALIDTSLTKKSQFLYRFDINNKTTELIQLDSTIKYHQVFQYNDSINCLIGIKDSNLVVQAFKNNLADSKYFKVKYTKPLKIISVSRNRELILSLTYIVDKPYRIKIHTTTLLKTKGFASIIDSLSSVAPFDDKDKTFIVANDNNFGNVQQSSDYSSAKVLFKDSLDLSNSIVKIYTETGDEILTYSISKDQKDLPIQTDKLYHGTYFVRLFNKGEEHNLGKFIIVR